MLLALHSDFILLIPSLKVAVSEWAVPQQGCGGGGGRLKFSLRRMCFLVRTQAGASVGSAVQPDSGEIIGFGEPQLPGL